MVHSGGLGPAGILEHSPKRGPDLDDGSADSSGHHVSGAVEEVHEDRPAVELFGSRLRFRGKAQVVGSDGLSVG